MPSAPFLFGEIAEGVREVWIDRGRDQDRGRKPMTGQAPEQFGRHSIRLKGYDYSQAGGYYVTIVTLWRECLFGEVLGGEMRVNALGMIAQECWGEIPVHFPNVDVDAFAVMPNHVHGIIFIHENKQKPSYPPRGFKPGSVGAIVASFKSAVTRRAGRELNSGNIWQRNFYEHILRDQADYERIAGYILDSPANWDQDEENPQYPAGAGNDPARDLVNRSGD
jgi:REP element-mobilizing transposase RayT